MGVASFPPGFFDEPEPEPEPEMIFLLDLEDEPDTDIDIEAFAENVEIDRRTKLQVPRYGDPT